MSFFNSETDSSAAGAGISLGVAGTQGGMNPIADIQAGIAVAGLAMQIFGSNKAVEASKKSAAISSDIAAQEQAENAQRKQQMVLQASRTQLQTIRNAQLARSYAVNAAVGQGANFGSGLAGGEAQIRSDADTSILGVNQNLEIGKNIFSLDDKISADKMALAQVQSSMASAQGQSSLGGSIMKAAPMLGSLGGQFGGSSSNASIFDILAPGGGPP